jgi:hypothetical protein
MIWFAALHRHALASWYSARDPSQQDPDVVVDGGGRPVAKDERETKP